MCTSHHDGTYAVAIIFYVTVTCQEFIYKHFHCIYYWYKYLCIIILHYKYQYRVRVISLCPTLNGNSQWEWSPETNSTALLTSTDTVVMMGTRVAATDSNSLYLAYISRKHSLHQESCHVSSPEGGGCSQLSHQKGDGEAGLILSIYVQLKPWNIFLIMFMVLCAVMTC